MKVFLVVAVLCLLYFFCESPAWAFQNAPENAADCRAELARTIDSAMSVGSERGIGLLLARLPECKKCLPARDTALGNLYHKTGVLCYIADRYAEASHWFGRALEVRQNNPDATAESLLNTLNGLTQTHLLTFDFAKAEHCIEQQLAVLRAQKQPNREAEADLYFADGQLAFRREDYPRCREKLRIAAAIYREHSPANPNFGHVLNLSGAAADLLNAPAEALQFYRQAIPVFEKNGFRSDAARCLHNMGIAFNKLAKPDSALFFLKKSADIHRAEGDSVEIARHFVEMAKVLAGQGNSGAALGFAQKSLALRTTLLPDWHPDVLESQVFLGQLFLAGGRETEALALFEDAVTAAARSPRPDQIIAPMAEKAHFLAQKGKKDIEFARQAHEFYGRLDSLVHRARLGLRHDESKIAFAQTVRDVYENAILNALWLFENSADTRFFDDALALCERSKSVSLRDHLRRRAAQGFAGLPDSVLQREQQLHLRVGAQTEALLAAGHSPDSVRFALLRALEEAKEAQEEFNEHLETHYPKYFSLVYAPAKNPSVSTLQGSLPPQTLLLEFFAGDSNLVVFAVGKTGFRFWQTPRKHEIFEDIRQFLPLADGQKQASMAVFCQLSRRIFRQVLEVPLAHFSKTEDVCRLRIVPDGLLAAVPFDALLTDESEQLDANAPFLLKKYSVGLLFSNRLLTERPPAKHWFGQPECAVFGVDYRDAPSLFAGGRADVAADFVPAALPFSGAEVQAVGLQTGGEVFQNRQATAANFLRETGESELLHVAAHGVFNAENPMLSGLLFSKSGPDDSLPNLLTAARMYGLRTDAAFVFLSACNTGKGQLIESEGIMSLARALTYAGVKSQVMTLWEVSDRATGQIAERFYGHLRAGLAKDEALRLSKLDYLANCPTVAGQHPFFWAGAVVFGNSEPLFVWYAWRWLAVGLLVLLGLGMTLRQVRRNRSAA
ncbi:MAG: CHAT domain-containing protein [Saprospiraceae bacterium]